MELKKYVEILNTRFQTGISREHSYRGDLQTLLQSLLTDILVTNEPARIKCGAPDYILTRKDIPIGYIEAKDIGIDLKHKSLKEQFDRYKSALDNLIFTDYLDFHFYKQGEFVTSIKIGKVVDKQIVPISENFDRFIVLISNFAQQVTQSIRSPNKLAQMMAAKAKLMARIIEEALDSDDHASIENRSEENSSLKEQMSAFKLVLIHDITNKTFADVYAQTIAYGMFAARYHDPTLPTFSREEAATLIPESNPFLRKLFRYIAGDLDHRLVWIVDELVQIFLATDVAKIMNDFGSFDLKNDPVIHFYETFLSEYDPKLRKSRGVWYTPRPVVSFITRSLDLMLKKELNLPLGLADTSKKMVNVSTDIIDNRTRLGVRQIEKSYHTVQILDPATGTGTFLSEVVNLIQEKFKGQEGLWSNYVEEHLIPRLNGFEILMASYSMAHLKLDFLLKSSGYLPTKNQRFNIYLTNSLEEYNKQTGTLFASWLSSEANQASLIKRDCPVLIIIGNPPYNGESNNRDPWIMNLINDYKYEPGNQRKKVRLKEKNSKWINDDYVKFIRYSQYLIEKTGTGIIGFINPHGYLDNPTFRGMRWSLLKTFDKIFVLDLHGNSNRNEKCPDGSPDKNVFDIEQGVCINFFVKNGQKDPNELAKVYHFDLFGLRNDKYDYLNSNNAYSVNYSEITPKSPSYLFLPFNDELFSDYAQGFSVNELFMKSSNGIVTGRDSFCIQNSHEGIKNLISNFVSLPVNDARQIYDLGNDSSEWKVSFAQADIIESGIDEKKIVKINYRPFENHYTYFTGKSKGFLCRPRSDVMSQYIFENKNIGLITTKSHRDLSFNHVFVTNIPSEAIFLSGTQSSNAHNFPLYTYSKNLNLLTEDQKSLKKHNLNEIIINNLSKKIKLPFKEFEENSNSLNPVSIFDYVYAILHSRKYREKFNSLLSKDYPKIPYPKSEKIFFKLSIIGQRIRDLHLFNDESIDNLITSFPKSGSNLISCSYSVNEPGWEIINEDYVRVWINESQYFDQVPLVAWHFIIGNYQPALKWLKDHKGEVLGFEKILYYQKVINILYKTHNSMLEIDEIDFI